MQQPTNSPLAQPMGSTPARPPNYLIRALILLVVLSPLCLLLGSSSLYTAWKLLEGPTYRSETPAWMSALMQLLRVVVALIGFFIPIIAVINALKVNREFDAGNYVGAEKASRMAKSYSRQSIIFLVLMLLIMVLDLVIYMS